MMITWSAFLLHIQENRYLFPAWKPAIFTELLCRFFPQSFQETVPSISTSISTVNTSCPFFPISHLQSYSSLAHFNCRTVDSARQRTGNEVPKWWMWIISHLCEHIKMTKLMKVYLFLFLDFRYCQTKCEKKWKESWNHLRSKAALQSSVCKALEFLC
jgi:hypothetical protein